MAKAPGGYRLLNGQRHPRRAVGQSPRSPTRQTGSDEGQEVPGHGTGGSEAWRVAGARETSIDIYELNHACRVPAWELFFDLSIE